LRAGADKRVTEVTLTAKGRKAIAHARPAWEVAQAQVVAKIGRERVAILRELAAELGKLA
jgi:DNA-binding MarR family transcriptional regulator